MVGIGSAIKGTIEGFANGASEIISKFVVDPTKQLEAQQEIMRLAFNTATQQMEVNKEEAKHPSIFVSGWRPAVGWVCAGSLAYAVIGYSFLTWLLLIAQQISGAPVPKLPEPDTTMTMEILAGMLGFGGLRTYEKLKGVHRT